MDGYQVFTVSWVKKMYAQCHVDCVKHTHIIHPRKTLFTMQKTHTIFQPDTKTQNSFHVSSHLIRLVKLQIERRRRKQRQTKHRVIQQVILDSSTIITIIHTILNNRPFHTLHTYMPLSPSPLYPKQTITKNCHQKKVKQNQ